jgi:UDP-N-acetylmuramoylalanine--D-glutamate ligase
MTALDETDMATRGAAYLASVRGRRVAVLGLARSGVAAARLLRDAGAHVDGIDARPLEALGADVAALAGLGVQLSTGGEGEAALRTAELIVVSPGVPADAAALQAARARGVPVIGELELGWRATTADTVAITGTNGKTTTTALTGALVAASARPVLVAGNIGTPLSAHATTLAPDSVVVCEVSSFQLETIETFHPRVAAVLNLAPDHLDRHRTFERYVDAKARIFLNQTPADAAVLNADDAPTRALAPRTRAELIWFSRRARVEPGVFIEDGWITARLGARAEPVGPVGEISLRGQHNVENVLAATACALRLGVRPEAIRGAIAAFRAVPHRIEFVRELDEIAYYNDSKGTNVDSTLKALESFGEPVLLIAGGVGKGQDFAPLAAAGRGRVRRALLIGEDAPRLEAALSAAGIDTERCATLEGAVGAARAAARAGDVVLLSPACASFDMFRDYEHRGDAFRHLVRGLR